jgi:cell division protease FtsH
MSLYKMSDNEPSSQQTRRRRIKPDPDPKKDQNNNGDDDNFNWKKAGRTPLIWIFIILTVLILANMMASNAVTEHEITYTQFKRLVDQKLVVRGEIIGNVFHGQLSQPQTIIVNGREIEYDRFITTIRVLDSDILAWWDENNIEYVFKQSGTNWTEVLFNFIPWVLIIGLWIFWMRRLQGGGPGGGKGIFSFGKSPAKMLSPDRPKVTFNDVAGCEEAKYELQEIIEFLKDPLKFQRLGGKIPKGALLLGPPGTGKTLLAKAAAGEAGVPFFSISGADFVEMFVGVGASRVRDLFEQAQKNSPCIVFIDEIDAVGRQRGAGLGGGHDEREQTLNQLLVQMDGFETDSSIIVIAATNRPDILDKALLRPGRFDRQIIVDVPDARGREGILKVHSKSIKIGKDVNLEVLAKGTPGMVGADLANLVNEAALLAARKERDEVIMDDFEDAKDKVMMGTERRSMIISDKDKKVTAYHEAGHALVGLFTPDTDPIHKVTIIPRGRALGVTHTLPTDEKRNYSRSYIKTQLVILLGGRTAEEIIFDEITTGAGNDIERATSLARKMVCEWGMSDKLGPMTFGRKHEEIFLGREFAQAPEYSGDTARTIDAEVSAIVKEAHDTARELLTKHKEDLHKIANALLEKEILDREELLELVGLESEKPLGKIAVENGNDSASKEDKPESDSESTIDVKV